MPEAFRNGRYADFNNAIKENVEPEQVVVFYAEDAVYNDIDGKTYNGREAIRERFQGVYDPAFKPAVTTSDEEFNVDGDTINVSGKFTYSAPNGDINGVFKQVWKRSAPDQEYFLEQVSSEKA